MDENRLLGDDTRGLIMPFEVSINIDSMWDFLMAETLVKNRLVRLPAHG
jgi:CMP-N-acetylneuraminic acid synthetase